MATTIEGFTSGGRTVPLEVFMPGPATGRCAAVLVLHGSFGLLPPYETDIVSFAQALASRGIAAVMPHYLEATGTAPGRGVFALMPQLLPVWRRVCGDAFAVLARDARFDGAHLGLLGFSLGANLALGVAMDPPTGVHPNCVVDFFGPTQGLAAHCGKLPPVLILHGSEDKLVPLSESAHLVAQLHSAGKKAGQDYRFTPYEGEGHGFKGAALAKSRDEAVEFIRRTI